MAVQPMDSPVGVHQVGEPHSFGSSLVSIKRSS
jgi:hypothetical protein